jgi:hypothetical protein
MYGSVPRTGTCCADNRADRRRCAAAVEPTGPRVRRVRCSYGSRSYGSRYSYGRRYPYGRGYGYRPRGHGFLHGLFWGWMLSHFFRGGYGVPLWPFFLVIVLLLVSRRRRRYYGAY